MRHLMFCGTAALLVLVARHGLAQRPQADPPATAEPPVARPLGENPARSSVQGRRPTRQHPDQGRRHGRRRSRGWFDVEFPLIFDGPYAPGFPVYLPAYRYTGVTIVVPPSAPPVGYNAPPAGAAAVPPAAGQRRNEVPRPAPAPQPKPMGPLKASHARQKARAGRFMGFGDANFAKAKYHSALERYKTAMEIAPDVAETYFRQAFAQVAMGKYAKAAAALRRGLRVRSNWNGSPLRLDQLYDGGGLAKTSHLENLAAAEEANPFDADLLLVLGMQLFFDGQQQRAGVFFQRAAQLGGNEDQLLNDFLKPKPQGAADPAKDAPDASGKLVF